MLAGYYVTIPIAGVAMAALKAFFVAVVGVNQKGLDRLNTYIKQFFIHLILSERLLKPLLEFS